MGLSLKTRRAMLMKMSSSILRSRRRFVFPVLFPVLGLAVLAHACQVPVFRYALERWSPDAYEVVLTPGAGGWTEEENAALDLLESLRNSADVPVNLVPRVADENPDAKGGAMALLYPGRIPGLATAPIWTGPLTEKNVRALVDSPIRRELAKRILEGQSAIWLVVESGDAEADAVAEKLVGEAAKSAGERLEIPEGVVGRDEIASGAPLPADHENILQSDVPLQIAFSVLRVRRDDPAEELFLPMLLNLEDDLHEWASEPMAFPVFGRGRVLEPLVGKGINEANVLDYSGYLCGACSCEVKDQNPGMDLLMAVNWDAAMEGSEVMIEKLLPPLEGTAILMSEAAAAADGSASAASPAEAPPGPEGEAAPPGGANPGASGAFGPLVIALGAIVLLVAVGSIVVLRGSRK